MLKIDILGGATMALLTSTALFLQAGQTLRAADVSLYTVKKGLIYTQVDANSPIVESTNGYPFEVDAYQSANGTITNAWVQIPGSNAWTQLTLSPSQSFYEYTKKKNSLSKLNTSFPDGSYAFHIQTLHEGSLQPTLSLLGGTYPAAPHLSDFPSLQNINPNGYGRIDWSGFQGGTSTDFIRVQVNDATGNQILQTPNLEKEGALPGTATYLLLAPGVLTTGQTYSASVIFQKNTVVDRTSHPGSLGVAGYTAETKFHLTAGTAPAPDVKVIEVSKYTQWVQTNAGPASPQGAAPFLFNVSVQAYLPGILSTGLVLMPPGAGDASRNLLPQPDQVTLSYNDAALSAASLDSLYGLGTYRVGFGTAQDGSKSLSVTLHSVTNSPPPPHLENLAALQAVSAGQDLLVSWEPWTNGGPQDFIQLRVKDQLGNKAFETPDLGKVGAFIGTASNAVIKAGTLHPGQTYEINLFFKRVVEAGVTNYPGVLLLADYYSRTKASLQTLPSDVVSYRLSKGLVFAQTNTGAPALLPTNGALFSSVVQAFAPASVVSAVAVTPSNASKTLSHAPAGTLWSFTDSFPSQAALDATYVNGAYSLHLTGTNDGLKILPLALATAPYPNAPQILNFDSAQVINPTQSFTLSWTSFTGTATNQFIQLTVSDLAGNALFKTPDYGKLGALTGLDTSTLIPAGTLAANADYQAGLVFEAVEVADNTSYPGALGLVGLSATTQFTLSTKRPENPPVLSISFLAPSHQVQVAAQVVPAQAYRLDGTTNLPPQWGPIATNSSSSNTLIFTNPASAGRQFYRMVAWP